MWLTVVAWPVNTTRLTSREANAAHHTEQQHAKLIDQTANLLIQDLNVWPKYLAILKKLFAPNA